MTEIVGTLKAIKDGKEPAIKVGSIWYPCTRAMAQHGKHYQGTEVKVELSDFRLVKAIVRQ